MGLSMAAAAALHCKEDRRPAAAKVGAIAAAVQLLEALPQAVATAPAYAAAGSHNPERLQSGRPQRRRRDAVQNSELNLVAKAQGEGEAQLAVAVHHFVEGEACKICRSLPRLRPMQGVPAARTRCGELTKVEPLHLCCAQMVERCRWCHPQMLLTECQLCVGTLRVQVEIILDVYAQVSDALCNPQIARPIPGISGLATWCRRSQSLHERSANAKAGTTDANSS